MHTFDAIVKSLGEVVVIALLLGAGLPLIYAVGVRFWSMETVTAEGGTVRRNPAAQAIAYLCFAIVVVAVVAGILYIAKDFINHTFGIKLF
jgi:hypothetical protein